MKTKRLSRSSRKRALSFTVNSVMAMLLIHLAGCATPASERTNTGMADWMDGGKPTLQANRFSTGPDTDMDHFVGEVNDQLFIGVAVEDPNSSDGEARTVAVYLCDSRGVSKWLFEDVTGKRTTLDAGNTTVELALSNQRVTGTVSMADNSPQSFSARLASGEAGLYRVAYRQGGIDFSIDWIILADGRMRGPLDGKGNDVYPPPRRN